MKKLFWRSAIVLALPLAIISAAMMRHSVRDEVDYFRKVWRRGEP